MIIVILYTMLLLFIDSTAAKTQCLSALKQWYETMIPALFPMMLLSSILVDTGFAEKIGRLCNKTLLRFLKISDAGCYCLLTGFFFGFPMGAKTTSDLLRKQRIAPKEAEYLLAFINCIGPMYTLNLIHKLFPQQELWKLLVGIYGLPFLYGICIRYILYAKESFGTHSNIQSSTPRINSNFLDALYECVPKCGKSILMLGGYMVLFQISFVTLEHFLLSLNMQTIALYPLLEITGGLFLQTQDTSLSYVLFCTTFGGACCMLQTYSFLKPAGISMKKYVLHKTILACIAFLLGNLI